MVTANSGRQAYLGATMSLGSRCRLTGIQGSIMQPTMRTLLLAAVFAATVAAGVSGLTYRGETKEAGLIENACAKAAWPLIPSKCLDGGRGHDVRVIIDTPVGEERPGTLAMDARFKFAFE